MPKTIDYYLSVSSPWTYLGHRRLEEVAGRHGATINFKPCEFPKIFAVSGGLPVHQRPPQRQRYRLEELRRWQAYLEVPLVIEPKNAPPSNPGLPGRFAVSAPDNGSVGRLCGAILRTLWAEDRDISDPDVLRGIGDENGLDGAALLAAAESDAAGRALAANTEEAVSRDVFGAPTYIYGDELLWGQDRLDFLDRALGAD